MPPAVRRVALSDAIAAFSAQTRVMLDWAAGADPGAATGLDGWRVRDVLWHLALSAGALARAAGLRASGPPVEVADLVTGYASAAAEVADEARARVGDPASALAERAAAAETALAAGAAATIPLFGFPLRTADAVATRVLELVVHGDDLGVAPDRDALGIAVRLLTGVVAHLHPGRAVELRVAPFAATQLLSGTVHRRGTPAAVVSIGPLPWLRLATGRLSWAEAVETGAVQASGERSDLSPYLPILR